LQKLASPIRNKPLKIKATGSEIKFSPLLPKCHQAAIIIGGIIDIIIGFIIFPPKKSLKKWYSH
jgi:hypothetical protein